MHLLIRLRRVIRRLMPEQPDPFDLTPEDLEQIMQKGIEDMTQKPTNHGDLQSNIAALRRRIAWLDREAALMSETANRPDANLAAAAAELARLRSEKTEAAKLLADYELQVGIQN
jgi:septal ring factor EnvC (AmiA/AmiB activator)